MRCAKFGNSHFDVELSVFEKQTRQTRKFETTHIVKLGKFMLVF